MGCDLVCYLGADADALAAVAARTPARDGEAGWEHRDRIAQVYRAAHMPGFGEHHHLVYSPPEPGASPAGDGDTASDDGDDGDGWRRSCDPHAPHAHTHSLFTMIGVNHARDHECEDPPPGAPWVLRNGPRGLLWSVHDAGDATEAADGLDAHFPGEFEYLACWLRETAAHGATEYHLSC